MQHDLNGQPILVSRDRKGSSPSQSWRFRPCSTARDRSSVLSLVGGVLLMTHDAAVSVANAFVSSRLDYCNSLFRSLSKFNLHRLQSIQNSAARIVTNSSKYTRITLVLRKLHWLPVQFRSEFKLATLVYKFIHTGFPKYFAPYLSMYHNTYNTRRSQSVANFLNVPKFQPKIHKSTKQFGFSFAFDAPTVWNSLPEDIRASPTIASFRTKLKTYLYAKAYPP